MCQEKNFKILPYHQRKASLLLEETQVFRIKPPLHPTTFQIESGMLAHSFNAAAQKVEANRSF